MSQQSPRDPDIPMVLTAPAQHSSMIQPTLGRIVLGVFLGNLLSAVVIGLVVLVLSS